ncbi:MAG: adenylyl-sulfate kinase [Candidatus Thiodiazotropha sp. (ex Ctena orbiculata)]|uniref:Adenylyl-sulfate kinase n=1 Tax=Candidatus Thiodiazotropha taylori TaxID=2792791 RepID=A0A944QW33_9GAMM|nr:adenylyl-sulfate kinase [Candidatus Thiodiazotropha taylori]PUB90611.1 MAG: adenylyl-sulfate kinase [gamma proteobacterium symbiont of Ctena orbiculata]MBT2990634.1 adenylyl-sulfate kinase [Candidatus Thiodiazotropha taylori]MBT2998881.1 adenylyl-sulfate kinase [Candidatus Thiodiazotropha taylori]MBT3002829.1 adenylyl-sulfate kinase [Candidatus Thiodiazotropha taylori]
MDDNVFWHHATVTRERREKMNLHRAKLLWFTGLSGSGKSTLAHALEERLHQRGCRTYVFDGDNVRHGLCRDLGFGIEDRTENIRRIGEMSKLFVDAGTIALTAFISPILKDREKVRKLFQVGDFIEVYVKASVDTCEERDVKGLYKRARAGEIPNFTGISSPYEEPENPEIVIDTENRGIDECVDSLLESLESLDVIPTVVV